MGTGASCSAADAKAASVQIPDQFRPQSSAAVTGPLTGASPSAITLAGPVPAAGERSADCRFCAKAGQRAPF
jgi:hypothetical protein